MSQALFFRSAHLRFMPSLMRLRAAALSRRRPPDELLPLLCFKAEMACTIRSRSFSSTSMISAVFIGKKNSFLG
jgi:hypothetical protein